MIFLPSSGSSTRSLRNEKKMDHPRLNVANTRERALSRDRERTRSPNSCMHVRRIVRRISTAFAVSSINVIRQVAQSRLNDGRKRGSLYSSVDFFLLPYCALASSYLVIVVAAFLFSLLLPRHIFSHSSPPQSRK